MKLLRKASQLLVVDVQEKLLPAMTDGDHAAERAALLVRAAGRLDVPVTFSEQYPKGLGPTVASVAGASAEGAVTLPKTTFSCFGDDAIRRRLADLSSNGRHQIVICGIEAHVCVLQTALDLHAAGFAVAVVTDAIASRERTSKDIAILRLAQAGIAPVTSEMAMFEWIGEAGTAEFKAMLPLIK